MFILESVMRATKNLRLGALCLSFIFTTGCTTMAEAFTDTFCQGIGIMGGGSDSLWATVTFPVCLAVGLPVFAVMMPIAAIRDSNEEGRRKKSSQKWHDSIYAGDLAASEQCVLEDCPAAYLFPNESKTYRRAAENMLNAYQNEPEPGLKRQVLLIYAHNEMASVLKDESPKSRPHLEAVVRFGESKELWDYVNDPDFNEDDEDDEDDSLLNERLFQARGVPRYRIGRIQRILNETVIKLLVMDQDTRAAGDPYQPFVCDLVPYQKAADLALVANDGVKLYPPCREAEKKWRWQAISHLRKRIESGDLAAAEHCLLDCAKHNFGKCAVYYDVPCAWKRLRGLSADRIIIAYENKPKLDSHQQEMLEKARALKAEARD